VATPHTFRFGRWLGGSDKFLPNGIGFHRWLPDGETDALVFSTTESSAEVRIWSERFGTMDGKMIRYEHREKGFDSGVIPMQGLLDGGPLYGSLRCVLNDDDAANLASEREAASPVGKRLLRLIEGPAIKLVAAIRRQYGQYWLDEWSAWDSRRESLQSAVGAIRLEWRGPGNVWPDWRAVKVGRNVTNVEGRMPTAKDFREFINEADWRNLERIVNAGGHSAAVEYIGTWSRPAKSR
jgi:hypothetical protein